MDAVHPWPEGTFVQAGDKGIVISRSSKPSYVTAFVEAFLPEEIDGGGFFRGEALTIAEAESQAWKMYQRSANCVGHEWEKRGYTNGGGFCIHCGRFGSNVFTGEQLGQYCASCNEPTTHDRKPLTANKYIDGSKDEMVWFCKDHSRIATAERYALLKSIALRPDVLNPDRLASEISQYEFLLGCSED